VKPAISPPEAARSLTALEWLNFFVADVQTGVGPFLAAYLAARGWNPRDTGFALTLGGLVTVTAGPFAGSFLDRSRYKRGAVAGALALIAGGACLLSAGTDWLQVAPAQIMIGIAGAVLPPTLAALALGLVAPTGFDRQFGRNQAFNSSGNVFAALLLAGVSMRFDGKGIFLATALLAVPALVVLRRIDPASIEDTRAGVGRDGREQGAARINEDRIQEDRAAPWWRALLRKRSLLLFLLCSFLFHLANAAMLPQLGEMLARGSPRLSAPFMSACILVTQVVIAATAAWIGRAASRVGRKPLLLVGFGVLPIRGVLYTLTHAIWLLIGIQVLDGVANAIFVVVSILVVADLMRDTGRFNLAQGALGTTVGLGAALSNSLGGILAHRFGFAVSFLGLASVAAMAFALLWLTMPETGSRSTRLAAPSPGAVQATTRF
jgi:MFS family permease